MANRDGKTMAVVRDEAVENKPVLGKYSEKEMLTKLKALAPNNGKPGVNRDSLKSLRDQTLLVREVMVLTDTERPLRKRKLPQLLKYNIKGQAPRCKERTDRSFNRMQLSRASSTSGEFNMNDSNEYLYKRILLNSHSSGSLLTTEDNEKLPNASSVMDNAKDLHQSNKIASILVNTTGSVHGSNPVTPEHMDFQEVELLDLDDSSNSSDIEESKHDCPHSRSIRLISFIDDQFVRSAVPVGPLFQADVPEWTEPSSEVLVNGDSDSSKWLGTQVWPIEKRNVTTLRAVGKGRPSSCSCASPGSTTCVRHHVLEKNRLLQSDLGPLYHIWGFDEMGEEYSKSWTVKEQGRFDVLAKRQSSRTNLLQNAMQCFPSKCRKEIFSYYFNVFIPRFMSVQTRSLQQEVDSDVDDVKDAYNLHIRRRLKVTSTKSHGCRDVKAK